MVEIPAVLNPFLEAVFKRPTDAAISFLASKLRGPCVEFSFDEGLCGGPFQFTKEEDVVLDALNTFQSYSDNLFLNITALKNLDNAKVFLDVSSSQNRLDSFQIGKFFGSVSAGERTTLHLFRRRYLCVPAPKPQLNPPPQNQNRLLGAGTFNARYYFQAACPEADFPVDANQTVFFKVRVTHSRFNPQRPREEVEIRIVNYGDCPMSRILSASNNIKTQSKTRFRRTFAG